MMTSDWLVDVSDDRCTTSKHVTPLGHIILIPSQPVFNLSPYCYMLSGEATNTGLYNSYQHPLAHYM
jgi:hypothetical protein